jgi:hypothetical protein
MQDEVGILNGWIGKLAWLGEHLLASGVRLQDAALAGIARISPDKP